MAENRSIQPPFLWHVPPQAGCCRVEWTRAARTRWRSLASRIELTHHQLVDRHQQARTSTAGDRQSARAFSMTSRSGLRAGRHRRPPHPADLAERNIPDSTARKAAGVVGRTLSIANGRAPAGGHGPIGPWSSCRSSRPSRGRRHHRSGTSRTDGDNQACRPRDFAYLWVVEHGGGRVRVPTVRDRRLQRGGRLQGRPAVAGQTGTAAPLEATGARSGSGRHRPGC